MFWTKTIVAEKELTESELAAKMAALLGDVDSVEITEDGVAELFEQLARIDGLTDYLRDIMVKDINRYFAAQNDNERAIIRGGFSRVAYIRSILLDKKK